MQTDSLGLAGQVLLGRYRVEGPIAQGGMGVVYRGRDLRLQRPVCIKMFHRLSHNDGAFRASYDHFVQEAFTLSQLCHPNTLRIYDFGHLEDESKTPFQISELLEGGTLAQWVRREGARSPAEMLSLIGPVAGALSEAHARGIIHRDVKPSNIILALVGSRRIAKLGDFGIATMTGEIARTQASGAASTHAAGMRLCSPGWAAPEQLRGQLAAPAADVFALGLVTAFMLGGRTIFSARNERLWATERAHSDAHVERKLKEMALARELSEVVQRACRAAPEQRYESAETFARALREAAHAALRRGVGQVADDSTHALLDWEEPRSGVTSSLLLPADGPTSDLAPADLATSDAQLAHADARPVQPRLQTHVVIDCERDRELTVLGRRLTLFSAAGGGPLDLGGVAALLPSQARIRVTLLPSPGPLACINVKGLNCFVTAPGGRPAAAVNVDRDIDLDLLGVDRRRMDGVRCLFGRPADGQLLYRVDRITLALARAPLGAVLLDLGPGREFVLIHPGVPALRVGG